MKPYCPTEMPELWPVCAGRTLMGPLPDNRDLVDIISAICRGHGIQLATFSIHGNVTQTTLGVFDPQQQVFITARETIAGEIIHCGGWITGNPAALEVVARMAVADGAGNVIGGRLFSETLVLGAQIHIQEWLGPTMKRQADPHTGMDILALARTDTAGAP